ncbi:MAG: tetratricopeptide repeat protein [Vicingaceae bacterium]
MRYIFIYFGLLLNLSILANTRMDSLNSVWNDHSRADSVRMDAMGQLGWLHYGIGQYDSVLSDAFRLQELAERAGHKKYLSEAYHLRGKFYYRKSNFDLSLENHSKALELRQEIGDKRGISVSLISIGIVHSNQGDYSKAIELYKQAVVINEEIGDQRNMAVCYSNIGNIYWYQGAFGKAIESYTNALKIFEQLEDKGRMATTLSSIGMVYADQKNPNKAMEHYIQAIELNQEINNAIGMAYTYKNMGELYEKKLDFDTSMLYYKQGLKIFSTAGDKRGIAYSLQGVGNINFLQGNYRESLHQYHKSLVIFEEIGDNAGKALSLAGMTPIYIKERKYHEAIMYGSEALVLAQDLGVIEAIKLASGSLSESYAAMGQYKKSLELYKYYISIRDSLESEENHRMVIRQEYEYKYEKEALADSLANKERELQAELAHQTEMNHKDQTRNILLGSALLILLLAAGLYNRNRFIQKTSKKLEMSKNRAEEQRNRAERSEAFKQQFLANMSHEIRTPMNAVLGMTSLVLDTELSEKQANYLLAIKKSSESLLVIINDILDLSKLEAGKVELEKIPFSLKDQLKQVYDTLRFKAEEKALTFETEIDPNVPLLLMGDPSRLNQVLINLCGNSIKFTEKGKVGIKVELVEGSEADIRFRVSDTGIGISKEKIDHLFEAFEQAEASISRKYGGTGLGLSISKTLIELQKGAIAVESQMGQGSEFIFTIPYSIAKPEEYAGYLNHSEVDIVSLHGIRILVGEDNEFNQIVIKDTLHNLITDAQVDVVENGSLVVKKLESNEYDLILMDVNMPEMGGHEATRFIRENLDEHKRNIPIIALTASVLNTDISRCLHSGMNDYIPKPFRREELLATLMRHYDKNLQQAN